MFANAEKFFTVVAICVGAAGVVVAWSDVAFETKQFVVTLFLGMATVVSVCAIVVIVSNKAYLAGFYNQRSWLEGQQGEFAMRSAVSRPRAGDSKLFKRAGKTVGVLSLCFIFAAVLCRS